MLSLPRTAEAPKGTLSLVQRNAQAVVNNLNQNWIAQIVVLHGDAHAICIGI